MRKLKRFFTKKGIIIGLLLILLDATIGAAAVEYFDIISFSEKYSGEILLTVFGVGVFLLIKKWYKRRKVQTNSVSIYKEQ